jgi:DNA-binding transcriptional MocR family regulator
MSTDFLFDGTRGKPNDVVVERTLLDLPSPREMVEKHGPKVGQYPTADWSDNNGMFALRLAKADRYGIEDWRRWVVTHGGMGAIESILLAVKKMPRKGVILAEEFTYDRFLQAAKIHDLTVIGVRLTDEGMDLDHLDYCLKHNQVAALYQGLIGNPTGILTPFENIIKVSERAVGKFFHALDIAYLEVPADEDELPRYKAFPFDACPGTSFIVSDSKAGGTPALRSGGIILADQKYLDLFTHLNANTFLCTNFLVQAQILEIMENGILDNTLIPCLHKIYPARRKAHNQALDKFMPGHRKMDAGFFNLLQIPGITSPEKFIREVAKHPVKIVDASNCVTPDRRAYYQARNIFLTRLPVGSNTVEGNKLAIKTISEASQESRVFVRDPALAKAS